jgi:hypothetical protein
LHSALDRQIGNVEGMVWHRIWGMVWKNRVPMLVIALAVVQLLAWNKQQDNRQADRQDTSELHRAVTALAERLESPAINTTTNTP